MKQQNFLLAGVSSARTLLGRAVRAPRLRDPRGIYVFLALTGFLVSGCPSAVEPPPLSSLRRSGRVSFLCVGPDRVAAPLVNCPAGPHLSDGGLTSAKEGFELHALVTQTVSAEVAVVRLTGIDDDGSSSARVLDADSTNPGVTPLRVGQQPIDITSTPGGRASFVGVGEVGKPGIFALPTSCIFEPEGAETTRDLTTWPACSLSSAPGHMVVVIDPADASGRVRSSCGGSYAEAQPSAVAVGRECHADLSLEGGGAGRRKLLVSLPDEGRLVVLDAQALLDRPSGSFAPCEIEAELALETNVPASLTQQLPTDLSGVSCAAGATVQEYGPFPGPFRARPAGLSLGDGTLIVADQGSPLVHIVDVHDPCSLDEREPLVATSLTEPTRVVTTTRVALSPSTPDGKQYIYAIDEVGERTASVMVFDVSPGQSARVPLVRAGSAEMPLEPPDRIEFAAPAKDVTFALLDRPEFDEVTGSAASGVRCDPDPGLSSTAPGARHRPNLEDETGAQPSHFRGLFAYILLGNGGVTIVDVDDFDAACRRPIELNSKATADFRGCVADPTTPAYYTEDRSISGLPTVTDEASCRIVEPHRARSANLLITSDDTGTLAPSLRSFARLSWLGRGVPVNRGIPAGRLGPIMLGVDFSSTRPAQVYVGNQLYTRDDPSSPLIIDPKLAEQPSVVLPWIEPRAYPTTDIATVTFEGDLAGTKKTGFVDPDDGRLLDDQGFFCSMGVQSAELAAEEGRERFGLSQELSEKFGERHADYVQVVNLLRPEDDPYWDGAGKTCGEPVRDPSLDAFAACDTLFGDGVVTTTTTTRTTTSTPVNNGTTRPPTTTGTRTPTQTTTTTTTVTSTTTTTSGDDLLLVRDFRVRRAYQDHLEIEPRFATGEVADEVMDMLACCFPDPLFYKVRAGNQWVVKGEASGFRHTVQAVPITEDGQTQYLCARDCSPTLGTEQGRAFEISATDCADKDPNLTDYCPVGPRTDDDYICAYNARSGPVSPGGAASDCIFNGLTRRFAIYRGLAASQRGMSFGFEVVGGVSSYVVPLTDSSNRLILPVALTAVPSFGHLAVVDSQNRGLMMIDLQAARVADSFY